MRSEKIELFLTPREGAIPVRSIVGVFCQHENRFLLLKRSPASAQGGRWCLPAGKLEKGESTLEGARRELFEEAGITGDLMPFITFYLQSEELYYDFTLYRILFSKAPHLKIDPREHTEGEFLSWNKAKKLPLIHGGEEILLRCLEKAQVDFRP